MRGAFERCIADLESGTAGFAFASGMAAAATILELLKPGDHIIAVDDLYGGTYRLFDKVRKNSAGLDVTFVDFSDPLKVIKEIKPQTKMIWIETPTNPMLKLVDLRQVASLAKKHNLISVADNTFATPMIHRPLELGFDIVTHSTTKYLNGHSDIVGGAIVRISIFLESNMSLGTVIYFNRVILWVYYEQMQILIHTYRSEFKSLL